MVEAQVEVEAHVVALDGIDHHRTREALRNLAAEVGVERGEAQRWGHGHRYQQRVGHFVVVVCRDAQTALEELQVYTPVLVDGLLPCQIGVGKLRQDGAGAEMVGVARVVDVCTR